MAFMAYINRYDDSNYNEDFEGSIAKTSDEEGLFVYIRDLELFSSILL